MKKHKRLYFLIFSFIIGAISVLLVYFGIWDKFTSGLSTVAWWAWFLYLILAFYVSLTLHELGHFIAFYVQGIKLRAIYLTIFVFYKSMKGWRFTIKPKLWVLFGGLVVPDMDEIKDEASYLDVSNKFSKALIAAPIVTITFLVMSVLTFLLSFVFNTSDPWVGFISVFNFYIVLLSILYIYTFKLSNQMFYGDFVAYKKMKTDDIFKFVQINQYLSFGLAKRDYSSFMWEKSRLLLKDINLNRNVFHMMLLMTYLEGIIYHNMMPDLDIELKLKRVPVFSYAKVEHGLMALYDIALYEYKLGQVKEAYELIEKIEKSQGSKISEKVRTYLNYRARHVMHISYHQEFLDNKDNYPSEQLWIFEPIMDIYEDMEILHKPLTFKTYESIVDLSNKEEDIKKSE